MRFLKASWITACAVFCFASAPAHATFVTLDPGSFAAGTDISNAFSGVSLSTWSFTQSMVEEATYSPVYASNCSLCTGEFAGMSAFARQPSGGNFGNTYGAARYPIWDRDRDAGNLGPPPSSFDVLRADFVDPTNQVQALVQGYGYAGDPPELLAFASDGTLIGRCGADNYGNAPLGCTVTLLSPGIADAFRSAFSVSITSATNNIAFIAAGGTSAGAQIVSLSYASVPEPGSLGLMGIGLTLVFAMARRSRRFHGSTSGNGADRTLRG